MRVPRIYLETSVFNFFVDKSRGSAHTDTVRLFEEIAAGKYEAFTSAYVTEELECAEEGKRDMMLDLISNYKITVLKTDDEASRLADRYIAEEVIPQRYRMDGLHIAIATVSGMDMIISMNFEHIVKQKTIKMTTNINIISGYRAVEIYSPMEVVEDEED
jgi:hypothetical protein